MAAKAKILVVDDEVSIIDVLKGILKRQGYSVKTAADADEALEQIRKQTFDLMISDIRMAPIDGLELLQQAKQSQPHLAVVMMTAYAAVETAVEAMKNGAFDYICKPFKADELLVTVERALSYEHVMAENANLKETLRTKYHFRNLVGDHQSMQKVYSMIEKVAPTDSTVLILGESGTGKELVAKAIHCCSRRTEKPFVAINCAALPESLLESELFGHVKGAFTGASRFKKGLFETADGGTLLMDEVGSIPINMQLSLLRVLQEQEVRPVGGTETIPVNVRIVAATNENLEKRIAAGQFREDLYYRLSVIPIELPPLRDRRSDIPVLVTHFLEQIAERERRQFAMSPAAMQALQAYDWPGNVRELENVVNRAATLCDDDRITLDNMPDKLQEQSPLREETDSEEIAPPAGMSLKAFLREKERSYIREVLEQADGDKEAAAKALGISLATFYRKYSDD
jgi:DNA-binding NtrC family response regulator